MENTVKLSLKKHLELIKHEFYQALYDSGLNSFGVKSCSGTIILKSEQLKNVFGENLVIPKGLQQYIASIEKLS